MEPFPSGPRRRRRGRFVPLSRVPLPPGAPAALVRAVRGARLRQALGPVLGPLLRDWRAHGDEVVLVLAGPSRLAPRLAGIEDDLRAAAARALERPVRRVVLRTASIDSIPEER